MAKKIISWKTKGMNRDMSVSAFNPEFAFENLNLRLSTNEGNTMMSWVSEKGTSSIDITNFMDYDGSTLSGGIIGIPIGTAVINHKLVLFTHNTITVPGGLQDNIYIITLRDDGSFAGKRIYRGNLNFNTEHPLETLVSYESNEIQKVYWTDGLNQPRMINIAASQDKINKWNSSNVAFDFVPTIDTENLEVTIDKQSSGGIFAPGVIQYCISFINRNGQQSNIAYTSPLYYLSHNDRGASPEDRVSNSFNITIKNVDNNFDYVRLYSIQRTSLNDTPIVKLLEDLPIIATTIEDTTTYNASYIDTGSNGFSMDPTELLFVGGREISALTMTEKDGTLFLGNIKQKDALLNSIQQYFTQYTPDILFDVDEDIKKVNLNYDNSNYFNNFSLDKDSRELTTFKGGETYRFGIQLQKYNGEWTEPIFIKDETNTIYPQKTSGENLERDVLLPFAKSTISISALANAYDSDNVSSFYNTFKKIRPIIVYPNISDRTILCQGILNPTVFNVEDRATNSPFAQASWFFRPTYDDTARDNKSYLSSVHYSHLVNVSDDNAENVENYKYMEIQGAKSEYDNVFQSKKDSLKTNTQFFVDQSIVTLNSPDLEFDTEVQTFGTEGINLRVVGVIPITGTASSHKIKSSSSMLETNYDSSSEQITVNRIFGTGEINKNVIWKNNTQARFRLISEFLWNDVKVDVTIESEKTIIKTSPNTVNYCIYPWQRTGPLNSDTRSKSESSSFLETKRIANLWFSCDSFYIQEQEASEGVIAVTFPSYENIGIQTHLTENADIINYRLPKQESRLSAINYYPNIDKVLVNANKYGIGYKGKAKDTDNGTYFNACNVVDPISMKYKSTSHAAISLPGGRINEGTYATYPYISALPYGIYKVSSSPSKTYGKFTDIIIRRPSSIGNTFWGDNIGDVRQKSVDITSFWNSPDTAFLWLGEIYKNVSDEARFGGTGREAILSNNWLPAGESITIDSTNPEVDLKWTEGDTYYQRYDCLKTYPFTEEDTNQIVEILSFMCETHVNIDGRYDRNRGQLDNTMMRPTNFNILNSVYSQRNNFFTYRKIDTEGVTETTYPNQIFFTKTKENGADVDLWTNVTLASMLELDGDKGETTSLQRFNDQLIAFQDSGISQILYNENVQIASTQGVPIEIANSGKVQGKRYISNTIGCSNKWSIANTPAGIYFMDNNDKSIYLFNGQLNNLSATLGFNSWAKENIPSSVVKWNPEDFDGFVTYYDKLNQDVLFINKDTALAYSEKFNCFTSFYDYGNIPYLCNLDDDAIWVKGNTLWKHQGGDYCKFFGVNKPFSMTLIANQEPQTDKIFTNLEFRATVEGEGTTTDNKYSPTLPFNSLEAWDEYQHGITTLNVRQSQSSSAKATLDRKFRMWRCDIPRDNAEIDSTTESKMGITRFAVHKLDRMRNPWIYLKLKKDAATSGSLHKTEVHDIMATYFG